LYSQEENKIEFGFNLIKQNTFYQYEFDVDNVALKNSNHGYGLSVSIPMNTFISFHTGLQLSNQGQSFLIVATEDNYGDALTYFSTEIKLQYIKLPLMFKLGGDKSKNKRLTLNASLGPQLSFLKKATTIFEGIEDDYAEFMNKKTIDIAGSIGIDCKIIKNIYFNIAYRFDYSITSAEPKRLISPYTKKKIATHNRTKGCLFGFSFLI
jgi:hypothetical protein